MLPLEQFVTFKSKPLLKDFGCPGTQNKKSHKLFPFEKLQKSHGGLPSICKGLVAVFVQSDPRPCYMYLPQCSA